MATPEPLLQAKTVISWFKESVIYEKQAVPNEEQVEGLLNFLRRARAGQSARVTPWRNPEANGRFQKALKDLESVASECLEDTHNNLRRNAEEQELLPGRSFLEVMGSKLQHDQEALTHLINSVRANREYFMVRRHRTRVEPWHDLARAINLHVSKAFLDAGRKKISVSKEGAPVIRVVTEALCYLEGFERKGSSIVGVFRRRNPAKKSDD